MGSTRSKKRTSAALMAAEAMPTAERLKQASGAFHIGGDRRSGRIFRMLDAPLERIYADKKLNETEYESLKRLRMHYTLGQLSGSPQSVDFNRVSFRWRGDSQTERELFHREMFASGWLAMLPLERGVIGAVVLSEIELAMVGEFLGYRSPYRGRVAALDLLRAGAAKLATTWKL